MLGTSSEVIKKTQTNNKGEKKKTKATKRKGMCQTRKYRKNMKMSKED